MNSESGPRSSARPRLAPVEAGGGTPLRFGDDPYVWASWLYYQEGMTQNDIAQMMGISRATVIAYLNEARERGIVNIAIEPGAACIVDDRPIPEEPFQPTRMPRRSQWRR